MGAKGDDYFSKGLLHFVENIGHSKTQNLGLIVPFGTAIVMVFSDTFV